MHAVAFAIIFLVLSSDPAIEEKTFSKGLNRVPWVKIPTEKTFSAAIKNIFDAWMRDVEPRDNVFIGVEELDWTSS